MDLQNKKIVFFGDSITDSAKFSNPNYPYGAGYFNMVKSELDVFYPQFNLKLYNEGISGNKTENLLERFDKDVVPHKPDLVVLFIGINIRFTASLCVLDVYLAGTKRKTQ
jgi:lysophospholipase L1-like esterase